MRYEGIPWLAGWSFFFLPFFSWLRLHGSSRENLADRGFGLWRCIPTASFPFFWCKKMDFVCIEDLGFGACDTSIPAGEADVF